MAQHLSEKTVEQIRNITIVYEARIREHRIVGWEEMP